MNELAVVTHEGRGLMSPTDLRTQVNAIQQAMQAVMKEGTHYGKVPGTDKNSLFKAGSEVLLTMFHVAVDPQVDDLSDGDHIRYRVRCRGVHQPTGILLGTGIGEASTQEEKYCWRRAVCEEEFNTTDPTRRRIKYSLWNGKVSETRQVRTNPADLANTVLKMAKKRAQIDLTLTATAASDIFTQDVEDLPPEVVDQVAGSGRQQVQQPAAKSSAKGGKPERTTRSDEDADKAPATAGQLAYLVKQVTTDGHPGLEAVLAHFQLKSLDGITLGQWKAIKAWVANHSLPPAETATSKAETATSADVAQ